MPSEALLSPLSITDLAASKSEARQPLTELPCPRPVSKMRKYPNTKPQPPGSLLLWFSTSSSYHLHCPVPTPASLLGHPNAKNETIYLGPIHLPLIQPRYLGKPICKCTRTFTPQSTPIRVSVQIRTFSQCLFISTGSTLNQILCILLKSPYHSYQGRKWCGG